MNPRYKKVYTCTPVAFHANDWFFIRDSGLICRSLRQLGAESKVIMPLPYHDDDLRNEIIRTEYHHLESEAWWRSLGIDALVLYSWGAPRYRKIAKAVRAAGIRLVIHMDSSGQFVHPFPKGTSLFRKIYTHLLVKAQDFFRAQHLNRADVITMGPDAAEAISRKLFYSKNIVAKCHPMPCPVSPTFCYEGGPKKDIILCIGRWDDEHQKRPQVLMQTLEHLYTTGCTPQTHIYGTLTEPLAAWHEQLPAHAKQHIKLVGFVSNNQLKAIYNEARIILCTSSFESSHIVSAEALCCGCSVVTPDRPRDLRDLLWYTTKNSGTISHEDSPKSLAQALLHERQQWEAGKRNPHTIAKTWQPFFHADKVFNSIFQ